VQDGGRGGGAAQFNAGDHVWYGGKEATFVAYRGQLAAAIRFSATGVETAVRATKLGRSRRESLELALVTRR
jgi:hypothetical protein